MALDDEQYVLVADVVVDLHEQAGGRDGEEGQDGSPLRARC